MTWALGSTTPAPTDPPAETTSARGKSLPLLTASRLQAYRRCPREERLRYQIGLQPKQTEALRFGTLMHLGLEAWWLAADDRLAAALAAVAGQAADAFEQARVDCLLAGYDTRWADAGLTAIAVEHEFQLPLINPDTRAESRTWVLGGKMDVIARDAQGRCWVIEHKTSSVDICPGSDYIARLRLDGQVSMYLRAARELGHDPVGVIYDVIGKVGLRPYRATPVEVRKYTKDGRLYANQREQDETAEAYAERILASIAEGPEEYYQRATVVRLEAELAEFERELWQLAGTMRDAVRLGVAPRNPDACSRYGSMCAFFPLCTGEANEAAYDRSDNVHPELGPKEEATHG